MQTAAAVAAGRLLHAGSSIKARSICTLHSADLTVLSIEALRTRADVVVHLILEGQRAVRCENRATRWGSAAPPAPPAPPTHLATPTILAGVAVAFVGLNLAVLPRETGSAGARVAALARVGARSVVLTGSAIGAIVQV